MLIFILINVQYLQKAVFSFEKGLNCQNQSSSGSLHPVKKLPPPHYCYLKNPEPAGLQLFKKETPMQEKENPVEFVKLSRTLVVASENK